MFPIEESSFIYRLYQPISSIARMSFPTKERQRERSWTKKERKEKKERREETGRRTWGMGMSIKSERCRSEREQWGKEKGKKRKKKREERVQNNGRWKIKGEKLQEGMIYKNTRNEKKRGRERGDRPTPPRNRAKVKESWPIPQSVGRLPISRLPFSLQRRGGKTSQRGYRRLDHPLSNRGGRERKRGYHREIYTGLPPFRRSVDPAWR